MKHKTALYLGSLLIGWQLSAFAAPVDDALAGYEKQGASGFSADGGRTLWTKTFTDAASGQSRSCASCHTDDPRAAGKHAKTGKPIEPMAPSVNAKRLTDVAKMEKWFKRNCNWTMGRDCTAQEKGDFLVYLRSQ